MPNLPTTVIGNKKAMLAVDMFTGDIQAYPMRDRSAKRHEAQAHWTLCNYCFNEGQMLMQN